MLSNFELSVRFFLQLAFILGMCRLCGWLTMLGTPVSVILATR